MEDTIFWFAVKNIHGIGEITFKKLLNQWGDIKIIFQKIEDKEIKDKAFSQASEELEKADKLGIKYITYNSPHYPESLRQIYAPPPVLYYFGNIELLKEKNAIALVGTRNPSDYGKNVCIDIVKHIAESGIITISGLARGIDSIVHSESIKHNTPTIAVLGSGINIIYPASNKKLFHNIREHGLIISEFKLDTKPESGNFPKRNRLISGLSKGVVVIEASKKSGSLITAEFAVNQGKDVFAVPGSVYSYKSKGTNYLIKSGAYLVENGRDIIDVLFPGEIPQKLKKQDNIHIHFDSAELETIYNIIKKNPVTIDELVISTGLNVANISVLLTNLQIMGYIKEQNGKTYVANL